MEGGGESRGACVSGRSAAPAGRACAGGSFGVWPDCSVVRAVRQVFGCGGLKINLCLLWFLANLGGDFCILLALRYKLLHCKIKLLMLFKFKLRIGKAINYVVPIYAWKRLESLPVDQFLPLKGFYYWESELVSTTTAS
jgi:hypothetical protein